MAHAKDAGIGQAFQQKSRAHEDKLRRFEADQLSCDMDSLFTEELHSDMTIKLRYKTLHLHSCILKARSLDLYDILFSLTGSCKETKTISMKTYPCSRTIEDLFRSLYTENDVTRCLSHFAQIFATGSDTSISTNSSGELLDSSDNASRRNKAEQDQSRTVLRDSCANLSESLPPNTKRELCASSSPPNFGVDFETIQDENKLDVIAGEIVAEAMRNAFLMYGDASTSLTNGDDSNTNVLHDNHTNGGDINYNADIENKVGKTGLISIEAKDIRTSESTSSEVVAGALRNSTSTENESESNEIKSTKQASDCSIAALLEKTYSMKTVLTPSGGLGEDLLRLWLTKTDCDAQILIDSHVFHVHKCILSCRSMYFGAMLGGSWKESDQDQILLEGIDNTTMRQTLLYLYGGVVEVDPSCSLGGLVKMSDMYTMEGLMEVVAFNLNKEYCHYFHKPCPKCIVGTPEALTLTMIYNMDTMREKCVKWINKNFGKVWPTKQFALLPQEVLEFCVSSAVKDLAINNVIDIMVECQLLNEKIPRLKWSESVLSMTASLMDAAIEFASQNFVNIVSSKTFRNIDNQGMAFNIQPLEDIFGMVIMALSPENSCQSYMALQKWVSLFEARKEEETIPIYSEEFADFVKFLFKKCKEHLCLYIHQAAHTVEWTYLPKDSQQQIMKEANYVCIDGPNKSRMARPQLTSMQKKVPAASRLSLKEYIDQHFGFKGVEKKSKIPLVKRSPARLEKAMGIPTRLKVSKTDGQAIGQKKRESSAGIRKDKTQKLPMSGATEQVEKRSSPGAKPTATVEKLSKERTEKSTITGVRPKKTIEKRASPSVKPKDVVECSNVAGDKVSKTVPFVKHKNQGKASPKSYAKLNNEFETSPMACIKLNEKEETPSLLGVKPKDKVEIPLIADARLQSLKTNALKKTPSKPTGMVSDPSLNKSKLVSLFKTKPRGLTSPINNSTFYRSSSDTLDEIESVDLKRDIIEPSSDERDISVENSTPLKCDILETITDDDDEIRNVEKYAALNEMDMTDDIDMNYYINDQISGEHSVVGGVEMAYVLDKTDDMDENYDTTGPDTDRPDIVIGVGEDLDWNKTDELGMNQITESSSDLCGYVVDDEKASDSDKDTVGIVFDLTESNLDKHGSIINVENEVQSTTDDDGLFCEAMLQKVPVVNDIEITLSSQRCLFSDQTADDFFNYRRELFVVEEILRPILEVQFVLPE